MINRLTYLLLALLVSFSTLAESRMRVYGYVINEDNRGIDLVNVLQEGTTTGTTTNKNGYYTLEVTAADSAVLVFSCIGYEPQRLVITQLQPVLQLSVQMTTDATILEDLEVKAHTKTVGMSEQLDAKSMRLMPDATGGSIESMLITFTGVSQSNELSSQYSVRGGNFDENCVYVNGIEVHRPQLIRAGQQEGLSFVNPDMVDHLNFSAGGFDARFGDKISSVLDITYKQPTAFEAKVTASLLGASAYVGVGGERWSQMHGIRYKTNQYMLGALETKGTYKPNFIDYQTYMTGFLDKQKKWELTFLGNISQNTYKYIPEESTTAFGTYSNAMQLTTYFDGQESDRFRTFFGAVGLNYRPRTGLKLSLNASGYYTDESENYDITGEYILSDKPQDESQEATTLGVGSYHQHARNQLNIGVYNLSHTGEWRRNGNTLSWGLTAQNEIISDRISEWESRDSMGYTLPRNPESVEVYYNMHSESGMNTIRMMGYVQDSYHWRGPGGSFTLTGGVRAQWWSWNHEFFASPRLNFTWLPGWKRDFGFRVATGLYYQSPFYKELRDTVTDALGVTRVTLNRDIKAQRCAQVLLGADYYFRAFGRPFKLTAEAYYKYADRVISYTVDNVRVRYSGENDAVAYTTGVDLKLYGELVPGEDSWLSVSWMKSMENIEGDDRGWISRPNESRYSISFYFQDHLPRHPEYKMHLKFTWQEGLPYGPPRNAALKSAYRGTDYKRVDIGASRVFSAKTDKFMQKPSAKHVDNWGVQVEFFNLLNFRNTESYYWVTDIQGLQYAAPNHLTRFLFNFKLSATFK